MKTRKLRPIALVGLMALTAPAFAQLGIANRTGGALNGTLSAATTPLAVSSSSGGALNSATNARVVRPDLPRPNTAPVGSALNRARDAATLPSSSVSGTAQAAGEAAADAASSGLPAPALPAVPNLNPRMPDVPAGASMSGDARGSGRAQAGHPRGSIVGTSRTIEVSGTGNAEGRAESGKVEGRASADANAEVKP